MHRKEQIVIPGHYNAVLERESTQSVVEIGERFDLAVIGQKIAGVDKDVACWESHLAVKTMRIANANDLQFSAPNHVMILTFAVEEIST